MPKNVLLFPENFILDSAATDSGIGALEIAVNNLSVVARSSAMRQAHALGTGGRNSIKNQNAGMPTLNGLLPTRSVGKYVALPSEPTGTVGLFISGSSNQEAGNLNFYETNTRTDRFTFASDTVVSLGARISTHMHYGIANPTCGYIFALFSNNATNQIWRVTFQSETFALLSSVLFPARYLGASLKNQSRGYACAGSNGGTVYGAVDRFTFAGEVCVSIGSSLQTRNHVSGFGSRFNGYIAGGYANGVSTQPTSNIERFSYASENKTAISAFLSVSRASMSTWVPGSVSASYLISGYAYAPFPTQQSIVRHYFSNAIDKFTFVGETCVALGSTLSKGNVFYGAVGNATRCVIGAGSTHIDSYETQNSYTDRSNEVRAITFATEINQVLGCVLSVGRSYLSGIDNSSF